ncbi:hypothetical protein [Bradyrhizobium sp. NP1]|uniref:hypothetical protein n=1 Tax=Bradyrhizobium sp. NP1 TaxID=3049772 RepID=UPI0025A5A5C2|nr:hypothetical protein [Bradyrhizobium sp. NP1]WJR76458.1 hypothetical protein QOU61_27395 [Bradyrhizobium sp. NP1]
MGLFDDYFDPQQFGEGGGLLGRLLALQQQQGQYQPSQGFGDANGEPGNGSAPNVTAMSAPAAFAPPSTPASGGQGFPAAQTPDYGQTLNIPIGNYGMPQFGRADVAQPAQQAPDLGDRVSAGFQSWAHTPVGNPFAALANGIAAFNAGQPVGGMQAFPSQNTRRLDEPPQPFAGVQDAAPTPVNAPAANRAAMRVLSSRIMPRPNSRNSRYGQ